jgi:hypothetical protein
MDKTRQYGDSIMLKAFFGACLLCAVAALPATAQGVAIESPWARASAGTSKMAAAYLAMTNLGDSVEKLVKAESPAATSVELRAHVIDGAALKLKTLGFIEVNPGDPTMLEPGGVHIALIGLKEPLIAGGKFPLTLTFESGKSATVQVAIRPAAATSGPAAHMPRAAQAPLKPTKS